MNVWSKYSELNYAPCNVCMHPWSESCIKMISGLAMDSIVGSIKFFLIVCGIQYLTSVLKKKKKSVMDFSRDAILSTSFGVLAVLVFMSTSCFLRNILKRYYWFTMFLVPGFFAGSTIFIQPKLTRTLFTRLILTFFFECLIKELKQQNKLTLTPSRLTAVFMILSSSLSTLLVNSKSDYNSGWIFIPPKVKKNGKTSDQVCFHEKNCWKHNWNTSKKYFYSGFALQLVKEIMNNFQKPLVILNYLVKPKTYKPAAFLGGYVSVYQFIRCYLYKKNDSWSPQHDTIAGFVSGAIFLFLPNLTTFTTAILSLCQILTGMACQQKKIPNLPYQELIFSVVIGIMVHICVNIPERAPKIFLYILNSVANKKLETISKNLKQITKNSIAV